jgi:uncharacterized protein (DUF1778 family)
MKKPTSDKRTARLEIRVTPSELARFKKAAAERGDTTSTWARKALLLYVTLKESLGALKRKEK